MFQNTVTIIWSSTSFGEVNTKQGLKIFLIFFFYLQEMKLVLWPNTPSCEYNVYVSPVVLKARKILLIIQVHLTLFLNLLRLRPIQMRKTIEIQVSHTQNPQTVK